MKDASGTSKWIRINSAQAAQRVGTHIKCTHSLPGAVSLLVKTFSANITPENPIAHDFM
jgi:hypothetical protein